MLVFFSDFRLNFVLPSYVLKKRSLGSKGIRTFDYSSFSLPFRILFNWTTFDIVRICSGDTHVLLTPGAWQNAVFHEGVNYNLFLYTIVMHMFLENYIGAREHGSNRSNEKKVHLNMQRTFKQCSKTAIIKFASMRHRNHLIC